jgi:uncharacterized protein (DUF1501 family)
VPIWRVGGNKSVIPAAPLLAAMQRAAAERAAAEHAVAEPERELSDDEQIARYEASFVRELRAHRARGSR